MLDQNDFMNMIPYAMLFISLNFNILIMCYSSELLDSQVYIKIYYIILYHNLFGFVFDDLFKNLLIRLRIICFLINIFGNLKTT